MAHPAVIAGVVAGTIFLADMLYFRIYDDHPMPDGPGYIAGAMYRAAVAVRGRLWGREEDTDAKAE